MTSLPIGPNVYSQVSRKQECSMNALSTYNSVWIIDHLDPNQRFEMQGKPVKSGDPILIRHASTSFYISSDPAHKFKTDFGLEFEVCVNNNSTKNRSQNLALEKDGKITGDIPSKFQED